MIGMNKENDTKRKIFDHKAIESKWQKYWEENNIYKTPDKADDKENYYILVEFPYPSGNLHVGHWHAFAVTDIYARYKRMLGFNVLYPIGFDAFGLPAENAAIKHKLNPRTWTEKNMEHMSGQLRSMGAMFDWSRKVATIDPNYYKWTQWQFVQFMKAGLAEQREVPANWCPSCKTVLANEQVINGACERCDSEVEKKDLKQWTLKITKYADRLIDDLDELDWPEEIKKSQKEWIGRSEGAEIDFPVKDRGESIKVFTTRPDTIFGATYMVLAPEHELVKKWLDEGVIENKEEAENYIKEAKKKSDIERTNAEKEKTGIKLRGVSAVNPALAKKRIIVIDGFTGDGQGAWKKHLKAELEKYGAEVELHALPDSGNPNFDKIMRHFDEVVQDGDIVVGHSLGGFVALKLAEKKNIEAYLVAPVTTTENINREQIEQSRAQGKNVDAMLEMVQENPVDFEAVANKIKSVFLSNDDYWIVWEGTKNLFEPSVVKELKGYKHFTNGDGVSEIPELLNAILDKATIPVFIADYVLAHYGTGAIMAVPAHDERDYEFAKKYDLPVLQVVNCASLPCAEKAKLINSGPFDGMGSEEAKKEIIKWLAGKDKWPVFEHDPFKEDVPVKERDNVSVILYDPKKDKYAFLEWKTTDWKTTIGGGIKDGESVIEAAKREIKEETGYADIKFISYTPNHISRGYAKHKNINRIAYWYGVYFELQSDVQETVDEKEKEAHEVVWLSVDEAKEFLNTEGSKYHFNAFLKLKEEGKLDNTQNPMRARIAKTYRLRDWVVSRQRYWGVPIPVVHCEKCGAVPEKEENLPVLLPETDDYLPSDDGQSPLAKVAEFVHTTCPQCGAPAKRETDTLDTFVDSSWYFLRYIDPENEKEFSSMKKQQIWMPVDFYSGGAEHTTMHLLYSRFWQKALFDLGLVKDSEPYKRRLNRGLIMGPDGQKMSKSKGNVIDPDEVVENVGSDSVRMYLAFMGPYNEPGHYPWNPDGVVSIRRFLERVYGLKFALKEESSEELKKLLHKTIKKVREDSERLKFNTAISAMMVFVRQAEKEGIAEADLQEFLKLMAPYAPHMAEELWHELASGESVHTQEYPEFDEALIKDDTIKLAVQINGKVRAEIEIPADASEDEVREVALANENIKKHLADKEIVKFIYVPGKIVNVVL